MVGITSTIAGGSALIAAAIKFALDSRQQVSSVIGPKDIRIQVGDQSLVVSGSAKQEDVAKLIAALQAVELPSAASAVSVREKDPEKREKS